MAKKHRHEPNWRRNVLAIGIAILFVMFVGYAIETFYPSPNYNDYCDEFRVAQFIENEGQCLDAGGSWNPNDVVRVPKLDNSSEGYCDLDYYCRQDFDTAQESYNRNIFFASLVIGIITFVVSVSLLVEAVSAGFMGGGVLLIIYGTLRYWGSLSDVWRTLMLGFALGVLVWVGYKKLK